MMLKFVWAPTFLAFRAMSSAQKGWVAPFPTVVVLRDTWVHVSAFDSGNVATIIEWMIYETLSFRAILGVPDVKPNNGHV